MQAKKRYLLVLLSCAFLAYCYFGGYRLKSNNVKQAPRTNHLRHFIDELDEELDKDLAASVFERRQLWTDPENRERCRMETCFDEARCERHGFKVFVYPQTDEDGTALYPVPSSSYQKILNVIVESRYHTRDPVEACLFVLAIDTLDRDPLSNDFVRNLPLRVQKLPYWDNGRNHLIFNLYSGTWPDYAEQTLGFDYGFAILAKASMSVVHLRPGFDVSFPLFHKEHPEKGGEPGLVTGNNFPAIKRHVLAFKGKRYVHGIGSETRNSLYHLHNEHDMVLVTTCRHGKNWKDMKDDRCDEDNQQYDRYVELHLPHHQSYMISMGYSCIGQTSRVNTNEIRPSLLLN